MTGHFFPLGPDYRRNCIDCDADVVNEYFMVTHELWAAFVPELRGHLCVVCLERRLGRELRAADFLDCPCNRPTSGRKTERLLKRMKTT